MANSDYCPCAVCGSKAFYDAGVDYEMAGEVRALYEECAMDYRLQLVPNSQPSD